jgi:hypothetical protein
MTLCAYAERHSLVDHAACHYAKCCGAWIAYLAWASMTKIKIGLQQLMTGVWVSWRPDQPEREVRRSEVKGVCQVRPSHLF